MLNDAQRSLLRIVMGLLEDKMRAIERQLGQPEERGLMSEIKNDLTPEMDRTLRLHMAEVYTLISDLKERFALPMDIKMASREILKGLPQLWVMLQESDSKRLRGYGAVDPADAKLLDPDIEKLAGLIFALEQILVAERFPARADGPPRKDDQMPRGVDLHVPQHQR